MNFYSLEKVKPAKIIFVKWMFLVIGAIFFLFGCHQLFTTYQFTSAALPADATVQSVERIESRDSDGRGTATYRPTLTYVDDAGDTQTARTYLSSTAYNYDIGAKVAVLYDPSSPTTVRVAGFLSIWLFGTVFAAMGAVFVMISLFLKPSMGDQSGDGSDGDQVTDAKRPKPKQKPRTPSGRR